MFPEPARRFPRPVSDDFGEQQNDSDGGDVVVEIRCERSLFGEHLTLIVLCGGCRDTGMTFNDDFTATRLAITDS